MVTAYFVARAPRLSDRALSRLPRRSAHLVCVAVPGLLLIGIIFGGVRSGVFTATESSCIAVLYALLVTVFVYRQTELERLRPRDARRGAHHRHGAAVIGTAAAFGWLMAYLKVPQSTDRVDERRSPTIR